MVELSSRYQREGRWGMTRRVERRADRMHEMMERLNVDGAALARVRQGKLYAESRARCLSCRASDHCRSWLESQTKPQPPPTFCSNLNVFEQFLKHPPE